jgi:hypothetical protein
MGVLEMVDDELPYDEFRLFVMSQRWVFEAAQQIDSGYPMIIGKRGSKLISESMSQYVGSQLGSATVYPRGSPRTVKKRALLFAPLRSEARRGV